MVFIIVFVVEDEEVNQCLTTCKNGKSTLVLCCLLQRKGKLIVVSLWLIVVKGKQ